MNLPNDPKRAAVDVAARLAQVWDEVEGDVVETANKGLHTTYPETLISALLAALRDIASAREARDSGCSSATVPES